MEIWKKINNYEFYEVSTFGRVRSLDKQVTSRGGVRLKKGKILSSGKTNNSYKLVMLSDNNKVKARRIHRLVAETFIPNPNNYPEVNHIDGNKSNNNINNLEWCTSSENKIHSYDTGLHDNSIGVKSNLNKYSVEMINTIILELNEGKYSQIELSKKYNVSPAHISRIKHKQTRLREDIY